MIYRQDAKNAKGIRHVPASRMDSGGPAAASRYGVIRAAPPEFAGLGARRRDAPPRSDSRPKSRAVAFGFLGALGALAVIFVFLNATQYES